MRLLCTFFVAATVKLQKFVINEPDFLSSEQGSNWHHQLRLSWLYPWHIMMSALRHAWQKYLINCHILSKYFELVFLQLQPVKISCKLIIIWVNYEKKEKGVPFMKHRVSPWSVLMSGVTADTAYRFIFSSSASCTLRAPPARMLQQQVFRCRVKHIPQKVLWLIEFTV